MERKNECLMKEYYFDVEAAYPLSIQRTNLGTRERDRDARVEKLF